MPPELPTTPEGSAPWLLVSAAFVKTGGQDRANFALASYLARHGQHIHLVTHRAGPDIGPATNVVCHAAPRPLQSDLLGEPFLQWLGSHWAWRLRSGAPRVVVNGGNCDWPDVNWVHYVHAAYDRTLEGGAFRRARMRVAHRRWVRDERRALGHARVIVANSKRTRDDLIDRVGVPAEKVRVIYYGIDATQFRPPTEGERAATRAAIGWPTDRPIALFIGALGDRRKGLDTLLRAWHMIDRSKSDPLLVVIGRGAMLAELQRQAIDAGMRESVVFLGFRDDVPQLVRAADMLIAPTRYEAYGLGVHEALCCGLPAIVSAQAGVAERYPAELHALLLPDADNAADLAHRVERCLASRVTMAGPMTSFAAGLRRRSWDDMAADVVAAASEAP